MSDHFPIPRKALDVLGPDFELQLAREAERPKVRRLPDGSLAWSGAPQEGAEGLLADAQALVDAGIAEWCW